MLTGFSNEQILSMLKSHTIWCKKACREILSRKTDFIPVLIDVLDKAIADPDRIIDEAEDILIPTVLLLAHMREPQAYPRLIKLISYDEKTVRMLWEEFLTENYSWIMRDTFNGDCSLLPTVIENRSISPWSRIVAVEAQSLLFIDGHLSREDITGYFRHLINTVYSGKPDDDDTIVLSMIADYVMVLHLNELLDDVLALYSKGAIDESFCGNKKEYTKAFYDPSRAPKDKHIDNVFQELDKWHWFDAIDYSDEADDYFDDDYYYDDDDDME
jgi:hypothetical protein